MSTTIKTVTSLPADLGGWKCNGGINPLIRDAAMLKQIAGGEYAEAVRWARIHLESYKIGYDGVIGEKTYPWKDHDDNTALCVYFDYKRNPWWTTRIPKPPFTFAIRTVAQFIAKHGGTQSMAACSGIADLRQSLRLIGQYNEFYPDRAIATFEDYHKTSFYSVGNPNNGSGAFDYRIAWEGSHAVYVTYRGKRVLTSDWTGWHDYSFEEFERDMNEMQGPMKADECDVTVSPTRATCRFWWD